MSARQPKRGSKKAHVLALLLDGRSTLEIMQAAGVTRTLLDTYRGELPAEGHVFRTVRDPRAVADDGRRPSPRPSPRARGEGEARG